MNLLFDIPPVLPPGFLYYPDFISEQEENNLINLIKEANLRPMIFQGFEAKRKTASFGNDYKFDSRTLRKGEAIPEEFNFLIGKVVPFLSINKKIGQLLLTEYPEDSVINWHRDAPQFEAIAGVSLGSDCVFKLRPYEKSKQGRGSVISFPVERRSLYIMQGEARTDWQHSIAPVKQHRYSLTLRTLR